ncbi:hypothetical protein CC1G_11284 [Coprinopsis cinerea okayama7|uniref:F-box domain-containing protein n=1 Tax=Coprinopsis cinerea (strain Okayama-7 / 130 / ATCC MYA-4618 / FGSC 9003) TaxID=240176 RepID=A8PDN8_COPC7|nr:hypothetical protein CC1G_11284 [Coprinopsis cinerea okayama7\|eukprot:XP_001840636.1 hypothetical protein CC1G_11284 [Coprinopsis cinerea okayama7\
MVTTATNDVLNVYRDSGAGSSSSKAIPNGKEATAASPPSISLITPSTSSSPIQAQPAHTATAQTQLSASARFHSIPDILADICEYLACEEDFDEMEREIPEELWMSRRNLANLARTCKAYLEPALDRLWRALNTLYPLFNVLPAFHKAAGTHVLRGTPTPAEWARFDWYARRVKRFCYTRDPAHLDIAMHVYFRMAQLRSTPLLPCLRHLYCPNISQSEFLISGVCLFLSPSLQSLEFAKITHIEDKLSGTFLHTLYEDGANLESVVFKGEGLSDGTLDLILPFEGLRMLELDGMGPVITLEWLKELGKKPKLEELALDFTNSSVEALQKDIGFANLKSLMLTAPISFTRAFIPNISSQSLETVVAVSTRDSSTERSAFISEIVDRYSSTLRSFGLVHVQNTDDPPEELELSNLSRLLPLRNLEEFRLEGYSMNLTDENVTILALAWPNITKLLLPFIGPEKVRPTYASLVNLRDLCPRLEHVRIPLEIMGIPPFVYPRPALPPFLIASNVVEAEEEEEEGPDSPVSSSLSSPSSESMPTPTTSEFPLPPTQPPSLPTVSSSSLSSSASSSSSSTPYTLHHHHNHHHRHHNRYRPPHPLQRLTISTTDDHETVEERLGDMRNLTHLARHVDYLFPRVRHVGAFGRQDEERWVHVGEMVAAFQGVRAETREGLLVGGW